MKKVLYYIFSYLFMASVIFVVVSGQDYPRISNIVHFFAWVMSLSTLLLLIPYAIVLVFGESWYIKMVSKEKEENRKKFLFRSSLFRKIYFLVWGLSLTVMYSSQEWYITAFLQFSLTVVTFMIHNKINGIYDKISSMNKTNGNFTNSVYSANVIDV